MIAYRIVIDMPKCHLGAQDDKAQVEQNLLYEIAEQMVGFMEERGFTAELSGNAQVSPQLSDAVSPYYRDYIAHPSPYGYQSLHITFFDNHARCFFEIQLRTKDMDDYAEIGPANHLGYERRQETERLRRNAIPVGEYIYFDEAYERGLALQTVDLTGIDVNMFSAISPSLINDCCGLFRGRLILPYEHLSRFQIDV